MRENYYAILASVSEFPTFTNYKMSITPLFLISWEELTLSEYKISYFIDVLALYRTVL